jgi:hypothetical protein
MYARLTRISIPADKVEQATAGIKQGSANLPGAPGFQHGVWVHDAGSSTITAVIVFDSVANADAAWEKFGKPAMERIGALGGTHTVGGGEVIHHV